jgi:hypothetical protein
MNAGDKNWNSINAIAILTMYLDVRNIKSVRNYKGGINFKY